MSREGKIHLVESCSFPRSSYKNVTNDEQYKALKEAAQNLHGGKNHLSEATTFNKMKKTLAEAKIDEEVQKRVLENLQEAGANIDDVEIWQFPISKINTKEEPNLNGRVYNMDLWKNVVNNQSDVWKGGTGLANHPADDEDGDFMKQSIVWLDGFIGDDGIVYGIGTLVGDGGALARQIISVGGRVGFSTSGYGDFLSDGITVDPEGYEIDRFADLVLNPSQGVYGDYRDNCKTKQVATVEESTKKEGNKSMKESVQKTQQVPLNESEDKKFKAKVDGEDKEFDTFEDLKAELKSHLKDEDEDFDEMSAEDFTEKYVGKEADLFDGVEETEIPELEESATLSEKLLVDYYTEEIKKINKESNRVYEKKIKKLESLLAKLKKENLNESSKLKINGQISKMVESIESDIKKAVKEGFDARDLCEELEISSLNKLSGIKEKIEDFSSLEECLVKATKEANKYKSLYEGQMDSTAGNVKETLRKEKALRSLRDENKALKESLESSEKKVVALQTQVKELRKESLSERTQKTANSLKEKQAKERIGKLSEQNSRLKDLTGEADKTIKALREALRKTRTALAEKEEIIKSLERGVNLEERKNNALRKNLQDASNRISTLNSNYEKTLKEAAAEKAGRVKAERYARHIDEDFASNFSDDGNIQDYYDQFDNYEFDGMDEAKTLEQAQNASIFNTELLGDEAEFERTSNRRPGEESDPLTLADMFN